MSNNEGRKPEKELVVAKIDNGIVIDHITPPGRAFYALKGLKIDEHFPHSVFVAINVPSEKLGRKDVLKIRNMKRENLDLEKLGLIIAGSNIIYIKNYKVIDKEKVKTPSTVTGVISCPGRNCITNMREDVQPKYRVISDQDPIRLRCEYCDIIFNVHEHISLMR
ncbi:MAG: aspartate carbamoyltransferase regulatory subunit [Candidatus Odinarchaeota archaeon]